MKNIIGITACPTGIAHTYLAAEALEQSGNEKGHEIKIETQGSGKAQNVLSKEDIANADIVIIAAAKKVDLSRFNGKKVYQVPIDVAVKNPDKVIEDAIVNAKLYKSNNKEEQSSEQKTGVYTHLMTGVSYMLPFTIAGGIIIALSFMFGIKAADPADPTYNVIAEMLSKIGGDTAFALMVPVLAAGISYSIANKAGIAAGMVAGLLATTIGAGFLGGLLGGLFAGYFTKFIVENFNFNKSLDTIKNLIVVPLVSVLVTGFIMLYIIGEPVKFALDALTNFLNSLGTTNGLVFGLLIGAMMAFDMGGPVNKAISTFSIGLMSTGVYAPIAACMVAGMTPPLGIALATVIFKKKFTKEEKDAGKSCWILGLSYITEGAIPFAVSDPLRVMPALIVGSSVAAGISMAANCTSLAPHGGIWIAPIPNVIGNLPMYILALVTGMVVTALVLGLLKKDKEVEGVLDVI